VRGLIRAVFFYDFSSPACYLAAERVNSTLPTVPIWQPIRLAALGGDADDAEPGRSSPPSTAELAGLERRAAAQGLPPLRLPEPWPGELGAALRAAAFAQACGRIVAFSLAALRQAFAGGRDLSDIDNVLIAAAACELHPRAVLKGIESRATEERLRAASEEASALGVRHLPAIVVGSRVLEGPTAPETAASALSTA